MNLSCFHDEWKPMLGSFSKFSKTNEFELLLQWTKANVKIVSKDFGNQWIWITFRWMPMLRSFRSSQKPNEIGLLS
jgi:hypothetical protein